MCGHSRGACALRKQCLRDRAATAAEKTSSKFFTAVGVMALAIAVGVALPAEAKKRAQKPAEEPIADPANGEPMILVVSLGNQKVDIYRGMTLITSSKRLDRHAGLRHQGGHIQHSRKAARITTPIIYSGAPMPWMQPDDLVGHCSSCRCRAWLSRLAWLHRLPFSFAPKLFGITTMGENVVVARDGSRLRSSSTRPIPTLPPPPAPISGQAGQPPTSPIEHRAHSASNPRPQHFPIVLARADIAGVTLDRTPTLGVLASSKVRIAEVAPTSPVASGRGRSRRDRGHARPCLRPFRWGAGAPSRGPQRASTPSMRTTRRRAQVRVGGRPEPSGPSRAEPRS